MADPDITEDRLLDGRILLRQPRSGHRAGTDAVLLAAAAPADLSGLVIDVGAGVGTVGLILASRCPAAELALVEKDAAIAGLAEENLCLNGLANRGSVYIADVFSKGSLKQSGLLAKKAALVITNPPFEDAKCVRISPIPGKRDAHVMAGEGTQRLTAWILACLALLADSGTFLMIHRPEAMPEILAACGKRLGGVALMSVHSHRDKPASRILLRGKKGSRAPLSISPPLVLQEQGRFTPLAEAIHRGTRLLEWL